MKTSFSQTLSAGLVFVPRAEVTRLCETRRCGFDSPREASAVPMSTPRVRRTERPVAARCFVSEPRFPRRKGDLRQCSPGESHREKSLRCPVPGIKAPTNARCCGSHGSPESPEGVRQGHTVARMSTAVQSPRFPLVKGSDLCPCVCVSSHTEGEASPKSHSDVHCGHKTDTGELDPRVHLLIA